MYDVRSTSQPTMGPGTGEIRHSNCSCRNPALAGDVTVQTGSSLDKYVNDLGRAIDAVDCRMANQLGAVLATAAAESELPKRPVQQDGSAGVSPP